MVKLGQQKQPNVQPQVPLSQLPPQEALLQSPSALHPQTPFLHWLPSGAFAQLVTQAPLEQQPPLQIDEALQEVEHEPPLQAIPFGQSVGPVQVPLSWWPTDGPSPLASSDASVAASWPASPDAPLELPLDPPS